METGLRLGPRDVTVALEGGGALGSFTWGVLDRLLDEPGLRIAAVSGTSAGAMNGAMLVQGLVMDGRAGAKSLLATFWHRVAIAAGSLPGPAGDWLQSMSAGMAPMFDAMRKAGSAMSGGVTFGSNPLRGVLAELLHPPLFTDPVAPELVVAATRVRTGEARLFWGSEVTIDALLASACLPLLFSAIEIDGEPYWDGGYSSNPPVRPLIEAGGPTDVIVVRTAPSERSRRPSGASAVKDRLSEITFGTPLRAELHSLALAQASLKGVDNLPPTLARLRDARLHMIEPIDGSDAALSALQPTWSNFSAQHERGVVAAEHWLGAHLDEVGERSSFDLAPYADGSVGFAHPVRPFMEGVVNAS